MKRKGRRKESVLTRQKPQKARGRGRRARVKPLVVLAVAGLLAGAAYGVRRLTQRPAPQAQVADAPAWRISLKLADDTPLTAKQQQEITDTARRLLGGGTRAELAQTAQAIQQLESYADVRIIKLAPGEVAVQARQRVPVLCLVADRLRLVATTGEVYGQASAAAQETQGAQAAQGVPCPGPVLTGVFAPDARFTLQSDFTLALGGEERTLVHEAVELVRVAREQFGGLTFTSMSVQKYRGFSAVLAGSGIEVAVGRAPFTPRLEKLQKILARLTEKHEQALRIELDYQGKAFIKLKKM